VPKASKIRRMIKKLFVRTRRTIPSQSKSTAVVDSKDSKSSEAVACPPQPAAAEPTGLKSSEPVASPSTSAAHSTSSQKYKKLRLHKRKRAWSAAQAILGEYD